MPTFETPGHVGLRLDVPAGRVTVQTWDEPRVDIDVTPVRADDLSRAAATETRVDATERGGRHEVTVRVPKREAGRFGIAWGRGPELEVVVRCPAGSDLELTTHSADLEALGALGDVGIRSASGDVNVLDTAKLALTTASGDLSAGAVAGTLTVKSASGDVDVQAVSGKANVGTVSGDLQLGRAGEAATLSTVSGDIDLGLAEASVHANSVSGDVAVAMRPGLSLWLDVQSVSGEIASELGVEDGPAGEGEPVELRVRTVSGDVRIVTAKGATAFHDA
ncbi:MAG TPA: DUF4097 family beta strand repeat-containing protein [Gaiella sp.]